jgi:hypothetical protein
MIRPILKVVAANRCLYFERERYAEKDYLLYQKGSRGQT